MKKPKLFKNLSQKTLANAKVFNSRSHIDALYKGEWETYSKVFLGHNPKCYACGRPSQATDHVVPHHGDLELFWKTDNLIPLCHSCHNTITNKFDRRHTPGNTELVNKKLAYLAFSRKTNDLSFKVKTVPRKKS